MNLFQKKQNSNGPTVSNEAEATGLSFWERYRKTIVLFGGCLLLLFIGRACSSKQETAKKEQRAAHVQRDVEREQADKNDQINLLRAQLLEEQKRSEAERAQNAALNSVAPNPLTPAQQQRLNAAATNDGKVDNGPAAYGPSQQPSSGNYPSTSAGQYTPVVSVDAERNEVTVRIRDSFGEREVSFDPRTGQGEVYEAEKRSFAIGDKVQITKPWTLTRGDVIANRGVGVIRELDDAGKAVLEIEGRRIVWNIADMPHVEYGYAMTSYNAQSLTVPRVAVHIDTEDSMIRSLIEKPLLYVGASRAGEDLAIFTDNRELLLDPQRSPILRQHDKPMALLSKEIEQESEIYARIA